MIKPSFAFGRHFGFSEAPWEYEVKGNVREYRSALRDPDLSEFSESDIEALDAALAMIRRLTFQQIRKITHDDPAYVVAWNRRGSSRRSPIDIEELLEDANEERIDNLRHKLMSS